MASIVGRGSRRLAMSSTTAAEEEKEQKYTWYRNWEQGVNQSSRNTASVCLGACVYLYSVLFSLQRTNASILCKYGPRHQRERDKSGCFFSVWFRIQSLLQKCVYMPLTPYTVLFNCILKQCCCFNHKVLVNFL